MTQDTLTSAIDRGNHKPDNAQPGQQPGQDQSYPAASPLMLGLIWSGVGMMVLAGLLMWTIFGPSIFIDLATAAVNCF